MKRTIDVGPTVSTVVAMLYLGIWVAGVFLCCCCLGRSRKIKTLLVWKGLRKGVDDLKVDIRVVSYPHLLKQSLRIIHYPKKRVMGRQVFTARSPKKFLYLWNTILGTWR